jgi:hypothetical protein
MLLLKFCRFCLDTVSALLNFYFAGSSFFGITLPGFMIKYAGSTLVFAYAFQAGRAAGFAASSLCGQAVNMKPNMRDDGHEKD